MPNRSCGFRLSAFAKVNLSLEVLGRRPDGFHEIVSVTQMISLADRVEVTPGAPLDVEMEPPLVEAGENLAFRAASLLAQTTERVATGRLRILKRIPLAAGLGGGSSDAAATLRLFDRLWDARASRPQLAEAASRLGSDVPLFLGAPTSLIGGRGERVTALPSPPTFWLVLVCPTGSPPDKTRALYRALTPDDWSDGVTTLALAEHLRAGRSLSGATLVNAFDSAASQVYPDFAERRARLTELLASPVYLTGAGPTLYALFETAGLAQQAARRVRQSGQPALVTRSVNRRPAIRASDGPLGRSH